MMKRLDKENSKRVTSPTSFLREVEIEFLLHELKDPISIIETGMRALLEKQEKYGPLSSRQEKTLKRTLRNTKKVREILNGLLEIGRSEAGRFICRRFHPVKIVYAVLMDTLEITVSNVPEQFRRSEQEEDIQAFLTNQGIFLDMTPQIIETEVLQDEIKFRQILGNLIKNALYHRKERINIRIHRDHEQMFIEVTDDGPGIEPEHHQMIFQRYAQVEDYSASPRKGHGLGLAGALIIAKCLGGNIELHSQKGQGATFRLSLPIMFVNSEGTQSEGTRRMTGYTGLE